MNLPNALTLSRFAFAGLVMYFLRQPGMPSQFIAFIFFAAGALTDLIDGKLARKYNLITPFGQLMDPIADKFLMFGAFLTFVELGVLPAWMVILMLTREVLITGFRFMGARRGIEIPAAKGGKRKTVIQTVSICVIFGYLVLKSTGRVSPETLGDLLAAIRFGMLFVVIYTLATGISYTARNWRHLRG